MTWEQPVDVAFGAGCLSTLTPTGPVLVLADPLALSITAANGLQERFSAHCIGWVWTKELPATVQHAHMLCEAAWPLLAAHPHATVLAIGGGTTLDLAKVIRFRFDALGRGPTETRWRSNSLESVSCRHDLWLAPTTAGTGSEVTPWATLWDTAANAPGKLSWAPANGFAERAWVDPLLTLSCPEHVTRDCGLDALAHALDAIWNQHSTPETTQMAVQSARNILHHLPLAMAAPGEVGARAALCQASLNAGLVMARTHTSLAHALSYELTLVEHLSHGEACAVWLPMSWEMAIGVSALCDVALGQICDMPPLQAAVYLRHWLLRLGVRARDLRHESLGEHTLAAALQSTRGRNFIAAQHPI